MNFIKIDNETWIPISTIKKIKLIYSKYTKSWQIRFDAENESYWSNFEFTRKEDATKWVESLLREKPGYYTTENTEEILKSLYEDL